MCGFFVNFTFERNCDVSKSKSPFILVNNKNEMPPEMKNPTRAFRRRTLRLHLYKNCESK